MRKVALIFITVLLCTSFRLYAQREVRLGIATDFGLPSGNFSNASSIGLGGSLQAEFPVSSAIAISLNGGIMNFFGKHNRILNVADLTYVPVKGGLKYYLGEGLYAEGQAGAAFALNVGQKTVFAWSPGLGNLFKLSGGRMLDLGIRYEAWTGKNDSGVVLVNSSTSRGFVGIRFAYVFGL